MDSGIYLIINLINHKAYIGSTCSTQGFKIRWPTHKRRLRGNYHPNKHLQYSWNKYGGDNFEFRILEECNDDMLVIREQAWMDYYKSQDRGFGYNNKEAGTHGKYSEETKRKMSLASKGKPKSKEHIKNMSIALTGKKHSDEWKTNHSRSMMGKRHPCSEEQKIRLRFINTGKKASEETKRKMSLARIGMKYLKKIEKV